MKSFMVVAAVLAMSACETVGEAGTCPLPEVAAAQFLGLSVAQFDHDSQAGWRAVADQQGCEARAAKMIGTYIATHGDTIPSAHRANLLWHQGQMWAAAGHTNKAIESFLATKPEGDEAQNLYADATIAFLRRDQQAFDHARAALAALPKPKNWDKAVADFEARFKRPGPVWPMNLDVVDRLGACFDSAYRQAYAGTCEAEASPSTSATAHRP
ncbi:hypothetical protein PbB2_03047 [Candidatus Phycosocius bacilliformis]|uniref:Lipoprotein n=1 Tax=Candidatus Phycosocius bacilliformis TaxID=1445552 RepID=A0A2P2EE76_9PROT|nr:hypothetical protein [Candidatus Phycosocius bacilliformis]GBF59351.1 hypothetical protein PbB2_03047 [Candidatus Phycosocius bacilliformis]